MRCRSCLASKELAVDGEPEPNQSTSTGQSWAAAAIHNVNALAPIVGWIAQH